VRAPALPVRLLRVRPRRLPVRPVALLRSRLRPRRVALPCRPARGSNSRAPCSASLLRPSEPKRRRRVQLLLPSPERHQVLALRHPARLRTEHRAAFRATPSIRSAERWWPIRQASVSTPTARAAARTAHRPRRAHLPARLLVSAHPHRPPVASAARRLPPRVDTAAHRPAVTDHHPALLPLAVFLHQAVEDSALRRRRRSDLRVALHHRRTANPKPGTPRRKGTALPRRATRRAVRWLLRQALVAPRARRVTP
jgi:hypothetical protein